MGDCNRKVHRAGLAVLKSVRRRFTYRLLAPRDSLLSVLEETIKFGGLDGARPGNIIPDGAAHVGLAIIAAARGTLGLRPLPQTGVVEGVAAGQHGD